MASCLLSAPAPTRGQLSELLCGCGCGLLLCKSLPPHPRLHLVQGRGWRQERGKGLRVDRRHLGYRRQVGADLQPKYDRGWGLPSVKKCPQAFCRKDTPVGSLMSFTCSGHVAPHAGAQAYHLPKHSHTQRQPSCAQTLPEHRAGVTTSDSCKELCPPTQAPSTISRSVPGTAPTVDVIPLPPPQ